jgi:uncharacterized protein YqjF (DUF2071 family)
MSGAFLKAEWRKLAMANYSVDRKIVEKYLPYKTELDTWSDICYVSLVGFMFLNTRLKGVKIPFHTNFEEVNLRFYVRFKDHEGWKRGVVFIKEIVPRHALTFVANTIYKENYETMNMNHSWIKSGDSLTVEYQWRKKNWNSFKVKAEMDAVDIHDGSKEEFITEHFWGYTAIAPNRTSEYGVEHPRWKVYPIREHSINVDFGDVYGQDFKFLLNERPESVFLAEGSEIVVKAGRRI